MRAALDGNYVLITEALQLEARHVANHEGQLAGVPPIWCTECGGCGEGVES